MAEFNRLLWSLDNEISSHDFERLCVDLLCREGYRHIVPLGGTKDQGRDAEHRVWKGESAQSEVVVFQFSLQQQWESKMKKDMIKVADSCPGVVHFVFVSSRDITGLMQSKMRTAYEPRYGWKITFYTREWFRHRLSELHPDLAKRYRLADDLPVTLPSCLSQIDLVATGDDLDALDFGDSSPELIRAQIIAATKKEPADCAHWYRLVKFENWQGNSAAALDAIRRAKPLAGADSFYEINLRLFEAGIIADLGISRASRPLLLQALPTLEWAASKLERAVDFYNLGNVYGALDRHDEADGSYTKSVEIDASDPRPWVNLASLCFKNGQKERGVQALDKALKANPRHLEALLTMASTSLLFFDRAIEAIGYFRTAAEFSEDIERFPHFRYWYAMALHRSGDDIGALEQIELGLEVHPGDQYLLDAKAGALSDLRKVDKKYEDAALEFMFFRAEAFPCDFGALAEIADICLTRGQPELLWKAINLNLCCEEFELRTVVEKLGFTLTDMKLGFEEASMHHRFREAARLSDHISWMWSAGLKPVDTILPVLEYALMPLFGRLAKRLRDSSHAMPREDHLSLFKETLAALATVFPMFGSKWLAPEKPKEHEQCLDFVTRGGLALMEIVTSELARMYGFLASYHGISVDMTTFSKEIDWADVQAGVIVDLMAQVMQEWGMSKPADTSKS